MLVSQPVCCKLVTYKEIFISLFMLLQPHLKLKLKNSFICRSIFLTCKILSFELDHKKVKYCLFLCPAQGFI